MWRGGVSPPLSDLVVFGFAHCPSDKIPLRRRALFRPVAPVEVDIATRGRNVEGRRLAAPFRSGRLRFRSLSVRQNTLAAPSPFSARRSGRGGYSDARAKCGGAASRRPFPIWSSSVSLIVRPTKYPCGAEPFFGPSLRSRWI